jgi:hypothetical protein
MTFLQCFKGTGVFAGVIIRDRHPTPWSRGNNLDLSNLRFSRRWLVTVNVVPSSLILSTLMMEAIRSSEMSVLTRATQRHIPEDGTLQSSHKSCPGHRLANTEWRCSWSSSFSFRRMQGFELDYMTRFRRKSFPVSHSQAIRPLLPVLSVILTAS